MASYMSSRIFFYLIVLFTIIYSIYGYRLYDLQNINSEQFVIEQQDQPRYNQLRSVLLPKICVKKLVDNQNLRDANHNHHLQRTTRKCYPFDMR
ncbi:unnamed protein product [Adineta steineri]|uniref:Uncharacterized protein n=1 Tax=Adineta steineri TaxID=433720 RepID=A0A815JNW9_9BILA|nr:unnamed protein product [Adineta steineri]CAF1380407.1 unnamed protein product [Adineta steineri]